MAVDFRKYTANEAAKQLALLEIHLRQFRAENTRFCLERYTVDELAKQLVLLEIHLRQFRADDAIFCMECCFKHLLAIEGLSDECVVFLVNYVERWKTMIAWSSAIRAGAQSGETTLAETQQWGNEAQEKRVWLQAGPLRFDGETMTTHMDCCIKHLFAIEGLADEGVVFFPEDPERWKELASWARDIREKAKSEETQLDDAQRWGNEAREKRKWLQTDFMGAGGRCFCTTGFEICCPKKGITTT